jgi:hypothetical protein
VSPVDHSVRPPIPELFQTQDDGGHVPSSVGSEEPWRVFERHDGGLSVLCESEVLPEETRELVVEPAALSGESLPMRRSNGRVLAGETSDENVDASEVASCDMTDILSE